MDPSTVSVAILLDYLQFLFANGFAWRTINLHRSFISSILWANIPLFVDSYEGCLMKCRQQCMLCLLGMWDRCYISCPSGTQHQEALHKLTWKVVFLLAICTTKKVSDLLLFSVHSSLCHVGDTSLVLQAAFGSKRDHLSYRVPPVKLKQCAEESLCPVRYLKEYIDKTKELRGVTTQLFISPFKPHRPVKLTTPGAG